VAVRVRANEHHPSHCLATAVAQRPPFRDLLGGFVRRSEALPLERYATLLWEHGFPEQVCFEKVYGHELPSTRAVGASVKSTSLNASSLAWRLGRRSASSPHTRSVCRTRWAPARPASTRSGACYSGDTRSRERLPRGHLAAKSWRSAAVTDFIEVQVHATPNPNALKFSVGRPLSRGPRTVTTAPDALGDPLAARLLAVPGVSRLFFLNDFVTVTREPGADWGPIISRVTAELQRHLAAGD
jgi:hypothetical protein